MHSRAYRDSNLMHQQLELFEPEWKPHDFSQRPFPFASKYAHYDFGHCGRWINYEDGEYIFSPFHHRNHIYSCYFTNRVKFTRWPACGLPRDFYDTDEEKAEREKQYLKYLADNNKLKPKKKRKSSKWSPEAKARNRRKRLRERIEKNHGYNPNQPTMLQEELLAKIEFEYKMTIAEMPDYYAGKDVEFF